MALKMNAAVVEQVGAPLMLKEYERPSPGAGQILVKTEACGVCHTDPHAQKGDWPVKPTLPFIPGHEAIGRVAAVGSGVTIVKEGDRVGVPWLYYACGHCEYYPAEQAGVISIPVKGPNETKRVIEAIIACLGDDQQARSFKVD